MEKIMNRDEVEKWEKKSQSDTSDPHGFFLMAFSKKIKDQKEKYK